MGERTKVHSGGDRGELMSERLKAISLWQPWASAMADGLKVNETRSWPTKYRGDLVICSAKHFPRKKDFVDVREYGLAMSLPYGCALCVVELWDCVSTDSIKDSLEPMELDLGDYAAGRFSWRTRNLRRLQFWPRVSGRQGFWWLSVEQSEAVRAAIGL